MKRIGILGIERLIEVKRPSGLVVLLPKIDVFLELGKDTKKSEQDVKENVHQVINNALKEEISSIEELSAKIAKELSKFAKQTEVKMEADYVVYRETPVTRQKTQATYKILARAMSENGKIKKMIGAEVMGIASCPCAQEGLTEHARENLDFSKEDTEKILAAVPIGSHNQRNIATLYIEVPEEYNLEVEGVIELLENSMSAKVYDVLKRKDEVHVVLESCKNPNFVEDVVRKILMDVMRNYVELPDESVIFAKSESFETIHQHNAIAERTSTLKELRQEVSSG
ncbi:GTP cyclohydrolase I FolE2 [archaeon]|nr:GTP cyclohydrolase I FolE2 [archaeon]